MFDHISSNQSNPGLTTVPPGPLTSNTQPSIPSDPVMKQFPNVLRVLSVNGEKEGERILNRAVVYHRLGSLKVDWLSVQLDSRIKLGSLVSLRPAARPSCNDGAIRVEWVKPLQHPAANVNLFDTIPPRWCKDRDLVTRAAGLWAELPMPLAHLFNAVCWNALRFQQFVMGPSSLGGHHSETNGNFRHSVQVAEIARDLARDGDGVNRALVILGGLLHDLGKASEYRLDASRRSFEMSHRGELVGHRDTLIEWLAVAREKAQVRIPENLWLALLHMLNANHAAPDGVGLRRPRTLEAEILSAADRLSGRQDLHARCGTITHFSQVKEMAGHGGRFGTYHRHLRVRPFILGAWNER